MYQIPLKGKYTAKPTVQSQNFGDAFGSMASTIFELRQLKIDIIKQLDEKVKEIDQIIANHTQITDKVVEKALEAANNANDSIEQVKKEALDIIETRALPGIQGEQGEPGTPADERRIAEYLESKLPPAVDTDKLTADILAKVPKVSTKDIVKGVLKALPENKASLKIIRENIEVDPMSVIDKILALPAGKFKLKTAHIDGLEQTISAFRNQITTKGYLHGGGDTVVAGTNITLVRTAGGQTIINATGGSGFTKLPATGTVDGTNKIFTFTQVPSEIVSDGVWLTELDNNGTPQWSNVGTTITMIVAPNNSIFGVA